MIVEASDRIDRFSFRSVAKTNCNSDIGCNGNCGYCMKNKQQIPSFMKRIKRLVRSACLRANVDDEILPGSYTQQTVNPISKIMGALQICN